MSEVANIPARAVDNMQVQLDSLTDASTMFRATFDTSTPEGQDMAFAALSDAEDLSAHLNETINLVHYVGQAVNLTDAATGEVTPAIRVILIDDEGNNYSAVSNELIRGLSMLSGIYGPPESWTEPKAVVVSEKRSKRGFRFYSILPATGGKGAKK